MGHFEVQASEGGTDPVTGISESIDYKVDYYYCDKCGAFRPEEVSAHRGS
jgi:hypothetical protein